MQASNQSTLILPSKQLPVALSHFTKPLTQRFLVGYRNVLVQNEQAISWALVKDSRYCCKAFLVELSEAQTHNIQLIKQEDQTIQVVGQNYILLKLDQSLWKPTSPFSQQQINQLFSYVGGINKINLSLLKNAFNSFEEYVEMTSKTSHLLISKDSPADIPLAEKIQLQNNAKRLSGTNLLQVPTMAKQSGEWNQDQSIKLKLPNL